MVAVNALVQTALADPWAALDAVLDGPLHPGGAEATRALLDRAGAAPGERLLDVGCGGGEAVALARDRGLAAVGVDRRAGSPNTVRGDLQRLPVAGDSVDVALAECVLCLAPDLDRALAEVDRVLADGGRLALADVVVDGAAPDLPGPLSEALCLTGPRSPDRVRSALDDAGFAIEELRDHRDDLLAMRDRVADRVDYERLLAALDESALLESVRDLEDAVTDGRVRYVSVVATRQ
ncbi:MAG: class I SAM-dependent methyltransferase [Halobacteriaceae archaeon]